MKKLIALMALVLCVVSCQKESFGLVVDQNGEAAVTLSVALPEGATRAAGADSALGAIDNGVSANYDVRFILEVYDVTNGTPVLAKGPMVESGKEDHAAFNLRLVPGRDYKFVVWADFVTEGTQDDLYYITANGLDEIAVDHTKWTAIDESRDAYTASVNVPNYSSTSKISNNENGTITLTRPFAKLRVVTNDIKDMIVKPKVVKINYFSTKFYTAFNALTEEPIDQSYNGHELVVDLSEDNYTSENPAATGEQTLFADYFFAKEGDIDRVMFNMDVVTTDGKEIPQITFNTNIPVSRNHLTTVYGPILTDANNITVIIDDKFADEKINVGEFDTVEKSFEEVLKEASNCNTATINLAGDIAWTTGSGHGSTPLMDETAKTQVLTINGNGHTLTAKGAGVGAIRLANGGKVIFNNVKVVDQSVSYAEDAWEFRYLEFGGALEFNDCQFVNGIQLEEANATFNRCSFNSNHNDEYAVWVCGNKAYFNKCTFEGPRGLKVHEDYGSEVEEVVVDATTFKNITKKPGIALGKLNAATTIVIKNSTFNNCQAGDQGNYIYESDTDVTKFDFTEEKNVVEVAATQENIAQVIKTNVENIVIKLTEDTTIDVGANDPRYYLGGEKTKSITIYGFTQSAIPVLTFNHKNSDWNYVRCTNDDAKLTIRALDLNNSGHNNGPWNRHDITFYNKVVLDGVFSQKAIALCNDADLTYVMISDQHVDNSDTYQLWIRPMGQTINMNTCVLLANSTKTGDRGIKIDNQYVDEGEAKVTLNVDGLKVKSQKKAAIVVKSQAGADINLANVDISNVYADPFHAVWVDEEAAAYADLVIVNGGKKMVEGDTNVAVVRGNDAMSSAIANGAETVYLNEGTYTVPAEAKGKTISIIGGENAVVDATYPYDQSLSGANITFEGVTIKGQTNGNYQGFTHTGDLTFNKCTFEGKLTVYSNSTFNNCVFNNKKDYAVWTSWGGDETKFVGCTFNSGGKALLVYGGSDGSKEKTLIVENCVFNSDATNATDKAAIETGNDYDATYNLYITNATVSDNFSVTTPKQDQGGDSLGTKVWGNKDRMPREKLNVYVDGVNVY